MTDSDKDLTQRLRQYLNSKYEVTVCYNGLRDEAADRIEELERERDELGRKLNTARYGQPDFAWAIHEGAMADLRTKLTRAVELALEECPFRAGTPKYDKWWHHRRDVLAELEGDTK